MRLSIAAALRLQYLYQGKRWLTSEGKLVSLRDLNDGHLQNLVLWLERHANSFRLEALSDAAGNDTQAWLLLTHTDPEVFMRQTPLYQALRAEADKRGLGAELADRLEQQELAMESDSEMNERPWVVRP